MREAGFDANCPAVALAVPDSGMVSVGFDAFDVTITLPLAAPVVVGANFTLKVVLCPALSVNEELMPLRVNPVPLIVTLETETLDPPVLVIVPERDLFDPAVTDPKLREVGFEPSCPGVAAPVPVSGIASVAFDASELTVTVPLALVAEVGEKMTLKVVLWPAVSVIEEVDPLTLNPVPLTVICEIVTLALPEFVIVSANDLFCPTVTLPKLRLVALLASCPVAVVPTPETGIVNVASEASEVIVRFPLEVPEAVGAN